MKRIHLKSRNHLGQLVTIDSTREVGILFTPGGLGLSPGQSGTLYGAIAQGYEYKGLTYPKTVPLTFSNSGATTCGSQSTGQTKTVTWVMANTLAGQNTVTQPQYLQGSSKAPVCGHRMQRDVYKYGTPAQQQVVDRLIAGQVVYLYPQTPNDKAVYISSTLLDQAPCAKPASYKVERTTPTCSNRVEHVTVTNLVGVSATPAELSLKSGESGEIHITVQQGYELQNQTTLPFTNNFDVQSCVRTVTPQAPTGSTPNCKCTAETVTMPPAQMCVRYDVQGELALAKYGDSVTVTASPASADCAFTKGATTRWAFTNSFNPKEQCKQPKPPVQQQPPTTVVVVQQPPQVVYVQQPVYAAAANQPLQPSIANTSLRGEGNGADGSIWLDVALMAAIGLGSLYILRRAIVSER